MIKNALANVEPRGEPWPHCQSNLLLEEIRLKKSNIRVLRKQFDNLRSSLQQQINSIDYAHICSKFLKISDLKLKSNRVF